MENLIEELGLILDIKFGYVDNVGTCCTLEVKTIRGNTSLNVEYTDLVAYINAGKISDLKNLIKTACVVNHFGGLYKFVRFLP